MALGAQKWWRLYTNLVCVQIWRIRNDEYGLDSEMFTLGLLMVNAVRYTKLRNGKDENERERVVELREKIGVIVVNIAGSEQYLFQAGPGRMIVLF